MTQKDLVDEWLVELRRLLGADLPLDAELDRACSVLSAFGVTTRYPGRLDLGHDDAETARTAARRLLSMIRPLTT